MKPLMATHTPIAIIRIHHNITPRFHGSRPSCTRSTAEPAGAAAVAPCLPQSGDKGIGLGNVEAGRDLYLGARVGVKAAPDLLVYAKGGYTNATFNLRSSDGTTEYNSDIDTDGYRVGAGIEYALSGNTYAKVEYRYSNYSDAEIDFEGDAPDVSIPDIDLDRHQVMAGFGMRF